MISDHGTDGISHTIHVAKEEDGGGLGDFEKFENVLDVMNLPSGDVKFYFEGGEKIISGGRIVRSTVKGVDDSFRYRCRRCDYSGSDIISQEDRGESVVIGCTVCNEETKHTKREIDDL